MKKVLKELFSWIKVFVIAFVVVIVTQRFIFTSVSVKGISMYPTLENNDRLILWILNYQPQLFDIVVVELPNGEHYIKRIMGLPGHNIEYYQQQMYIDGNPVAEPFISYSNFTMDFTLKEICDINEFLDCEIIPEGYFLILGDNRNNSADSRHMGLVSEEQILGRATWRYWPIPSFGRIE